MSNFNLNNLRLLFLDLKKYLTIKNVNKISIVLYTSSIILGILYLAIPSYNIIWDACGVVFIITMFFSFFVIYFTSRALNKSSSLGNRLNLMCYFYPFVLSIAMLLMMFGNFLMSVTYSSAFINNFGWYLMVYGGYFGTLVFGLCISALAVKNALNNELWVQAWTKIGKTKKIIKIVVQAFVLFMIVFGAYLAFIVIVGDRGILGMFFPELALGFSFIFLSATIIILKTIVRKNHLVLFNALAIVGIVLASIFFLPYALTPVAIPNAETNFADAFGNDWRERINPDVEQYFMKTQYSTPEYFLGINTDEYIVKTNIKFFDGKDSPYKIDENITLFFDVYMPKNRGIGLPGKNSTLIRIHGGSWTTYDKGVSNMMEMNKYFAAQGYIVFDIQYGLHRPNRQGDWLTPENVLGDFKIDDMVRHIGIFTKYLAANAKKYGANLNSVFISGGSAGGHLTCAVALAMASGEFYYMFSPNLKIKGLIPFYPANVLNSSWGNLKLVRPEFMVDANSPPCLVFQGYQDGLVRWTVSQRLKDTYTANGNEKCAVIYFPLAGHANDIYFSGHFNMVFVYYMERFMYLNR